MSPVASAAAARPAQTGELLPAIERLLTDPQLVDVPHGRARDMLPQSKRDPHVGKMLLAHRSHPFCWNSRFPRN
jgi:hypothetical protein